MTHFNLRETHEIIIEETLSFLFDGFNLNGCRVQTGTGGEEEERESCPLRAHPLPQYSVRPTGGAGKRQKYKADSERRPAAMDLTTGAKIHWGQILLLLFARQESKLFVQLT